MTKLISTTIMMELDDVATDNLDEIKCELSLNTEEAIEFALKAGREKIDTDRHAFANAFSEKNCVGSPERK